MAPAIVIEGSGMPFVIVVTVLFVLFSAAYNLITPLTTPVPLHARDGGAANPDEPAHILYVASVASGHIPVFSGSSADYEAAQPPLYYCVAAVAYKFAPSSAATRAHVVRFVSTILGVCLIWLTFFIVRDLMPFNEEAAAAAAMLVALLPMNISLSSSVSNDTATNVTFALFLFQLTRSLRASAGRDLQSFLLGLTVALGVWTKSSALIMVPVLVVTLLVTVYQKLLSRKEAVRLLLITVATSAVFASFWLVRNQVLYGDMFAAKVVFKQLAARNFATSSLIGAFGEQWYVNTFIVRTFASYWGVFDSMNLFLPMQLYAALAVISFVGMTAGVVFLVRSKKTPIDKSIYAAWISLFVFTVIAYFQYNAHFFQPQGRYLYPALIPLSIVSAIGLSSIVPHKYVRWMQYGSLIGLVFLNVLCLSMISGRYAS